MINPKEPNVSEHSLRSPQSRYVLPSFVERTSYGIKEMNPYNKLFEERIIFLGVQIDDASANGRHGPAADAGGHRPDREITIYINSPGGSMTSMMAIYDTMQFVQPDIRSAASGRRAASAAAILLAAGTKGQADGAAPTPGSSSTQPATEGGYGQSSDMEIQARGSADAHRMEVPFLAGTPARTRRRSAATSSGTSSSPPKRRRNTASSTEVMTMIKRGQRARRRGSVFLTGENSALPSRAAKRV